MFYTYDGGEVFLPTMMAQIRGDKGRSEGNHGIYKWLFLYSYEDEMRQGFLTVEGRSSGRCYRKVILDGNEVRE